MADDPDPDPGRRRFLKIATCGLGAGIGIAVTVPAAGYLIHPAGRKVVTSPTEPIDIGHVGMLRKDGMPTRIEVVAPAVLDAWTSATDVPLGAAWLARGGDGTLRAVSGICPHLGCAIALKPDPKNPLFVCPCHDSAFDALSGGRLSGPAKRDLDPLDVKIDEHGRIKLTWVKYKADIDKREPA